MGIILIFWPKWVQNRLLYKIPKEKIFLVNKVYCLKNGNNFNFFTEMGTKQIIIQNSARKNILNKLKIYIFCNSSWKIGGILDASRQIYKTYTYPKFTR